MMQSQEVIKELYDALIAQGLSPQEAMKQIKELLAATQAEEPRSTHPMMGEEFPGQEFPPLTLVEHLQQEAAFVSWDPTLDLC